METHTHTCLHCPATGEVEAEFSAKLRLPPEWKWWTRRAEAKNAAPCCGKCWDLMAATRVLRRVGGNVGRGARGGTRG